MMQTSIVLTVVSDDRPGIVEVLSEVIADHDGNWADSSMLSLAGKFAGILLVQLPSDNVDAFSAGLKALDSKGMQVVAQLSDAVPVAELAQEYSLELVGQDRPGIVRDITQVLADFGINVQELETTVQSASMSGESLFMANARIYIPDDTDRDKFQEKLEDLANELMVDIELET
jgi:glycine cleavage system regulatory protein